MSNVISSFLLGGALGAFAASVVFAPKKIVVLAIESRGVILSDDPSIIRRPVEPMTALGELWDPT